MTRPRVRLGDLSVGFVQPLGEALQQLGHDPAPLLRRYGLDHPRLAEAGARLSIPRYMHLGHAAIELCGEPALGLHMGRLSRLAQAGLAGVTAAQAPTLGEAARALLHFEPLYAANYRGQSSFQEDAHGAWLRFYSISPYNAYNRFVVDSLLAGWLAQLSHLAGHSVQAERMEIEFQAPSYAAQYRALSATPVQFGASSNQLRRTAPPWICPTSSIALAPGSTCCSCAKRNWPNAPACAAWVNASLICSARCSMVDRNRTLKPWRVTCNYPLGLCVASWPRKARAFAACSMTHAATSPKPTSAIRSWPSVKSLIFWGLPRRRPSSAHSSAGPA